MLAAALIGVAAVLEGRRQYDDAALALGVNLYRGKLTIPSVAEAHGMQYTPLAEAMD